MLNMLLAFLPMDSTAVFYGWDIVVYYFRYIMTCFWEYSWQARTSFTIIALCILLVMILFVLFARRVRSRNRIRKKYARLEKRYAEPLRQLLMMVEAPTEQQMQEAFGCTRQEMSKEDTQQLYALMNHLRQELQEVIYLPAIQAVCDFTGVKEQLERNLQDNVYVFETMQSLTTLQLIISEGRLANFLNHRTPMIRHMARLEYIICVDMDPYQYLLQDINEPLSPWQPMAIHQIFGWVKERGMRMPEFLTIVDGIKDPKVAAFFIYEIAYWGSDDEKSQLYTFFESPYVELRSAAFRAVIMICDASQEDAMIASYNRQPDWLKMEIMTAVHAIHSNRQVEFFKNVYKTSSSKKIQLMALNCLYDYSEESRRVFEYLRYDEMDNRILHDQVDSMHLLDQLRAIG